MVLSRLVKAASLSIILRVPGAHNDRFAVTTLSTVVKRLRQQTFSLVRMDGLESFVSGWLMSLLVLHISETDMKTDGKNSVLKWTSVEK
jgi:hypothetical protein